MENYLPHKDPELNMPVLAVVQTQVEIFMDGDGWRFCDSGKELPHNYAVIYWRSLTPKEGE